MKQWKPASRRSQAVTQMHTLLQHAAVGNRTQRLDLSRCGCVIAGAIWDRFKAGPGNYLQKHLAWFVRERIGVVLVSNIDRYFVAVCFISYKLKRLDDWWPKLGGEIARVSTLRGCPPIPRPSFKRQQRPAAERRPPEHLLRQVMAVSPRPSPLSH